MGKNAFEKSPEFLVWCIGTSLTSLCIVGIIATLPLQILLADDAPLNIRVSRAAVFLGCGAIVIFLFSTSEYLRAKKMYKRRLGGETILDVVKIDGPLTLLGFKVFRQIFSWLPHKQNKDVPKDNNK